jgi:hypothetical protein
VKQTLYSATIPDYLLNTLLDDFAVDLTAISKPKKGVCRINNYSFGVQEGPVMASGEYVQRGVHQGLVFYICT